MRTLGVGSGSHSYPLTMFAVKQLESAAANFDLLSNPLMDHVHKYQLSHNTSVRNCVAHSVNNKYDKILTEFRKVRNCIVGMLYTCPTLGFIGVCTSHLPSCLCI